MSDLRIYIQALRNGEFFKALKIVTAISDKYTRINDGELVGGEELLPLLILELCKEGVQASDLDHLNLLYNYIASDNSLMNGRLGYAMSVLSMAIPVAIMMQEMCASSDAPLKFTQNDIHQIILKTPQDIEDFVQSTSPFSQLTSLCQQEKHYRDYRSILDNTLDQPQLQQRFDAMDEQTWKNFEKDLRSFEKEERFAQEKEKRFAQSTMQLKEKLMEYKNHLHAKLLEADVIISGKAFLCLSGEMTPKLEKLIKRYKTITALDIKKLDLERAEDVHKVSLAVETCKKLAPDWLERTMLQKITDILSIGIRPLLRMFFSKEPRFTGQIEELTSSLHHSAAVA